MESATVQPGSPNAKPGSTDDLRSLPLQGTQVKSGTPPDGISQPEVQNNAIQHEQNKVEEKKTTRFLKFFTCFFGSTPTKKRSASRIVLLIVVLLACVAAGIFGYQWAFVKAKPKYATATVERGDVENDIVAAGVLQPLSYVDVGAQTSGLLKSLKVARGDKVTKGQLLA